MTDLDLGPDLHDLMDRSLADVHVPTDRLQHGAVQRGRVVRRRRRIATAAGAIALATVAAVVVVPGLAGSDPTEGQVAVDPGEHEQPFVPRGWWDMPVKPMHHHLEALLPEGVTIESYQKRSTDSAPGESTVFHGNFMGTIRDADDDGPGSIQIMMYELPRDRHSVAEARGQELTCDVENWDVDPLSDPVQCHTIRGSDGRVRERTVTHTQDGVTYVEVRRWVGRISTYFAVANSVERKWGPPASAAAAPLTLAELRTIAASPTWQDWTPPQK